MLWIQVSKSKEAVSLLFCILFSLLSLVFKSNVLVRGIASFQRVGDTVSGSIDGIGSFFKGAYTKLESFETIRQERDACVAAMDEYKLLPQDLDRLGRENETLRRELHFNTRQKFSSVKAEVLSVRLNSIYRTIIIDKGSEAGIKPYMPVTARSVDQKGEIIEALVGKVIAVTGGSAVVQPLINSNFNMGVSIPDSNLWASLSGNSGRGTEALMNYIDSGIVIDPRVFGDYPMGPTEMIQYTESLSKIGKAVYSSGSSGVFPPGIPVGIITEEGPRNGSFKTAFLKPFVRFDMLESVTIVLKLPEKWAETWPEGQNINIENPYFGELNYPKEDREPKNPVHPVQGGTIPPQPQNRKPVKPKAEGGPGFSEEEQNE
ncbi:rod shape-determining protein MreC [Leptospira inadai serovar Lyme str. 10]|uniref:Cell shape-determining protein MreC n=2 Tax=Leptospira inadai serovar Lyme TaxID=293084 RepID=V6HUJ3_9LEPT|nr:rod shape-determining protein MreC [Leptospira inadai]EQA36444.1 rod shape-determining protein MreC [Leptospira inadai serovar Lyme str. 10]PNV74606.1 rod shape-determining protein MreC [Leptospira inadai serovar Lyme]